MTVMQAELAALEKDAVVWDNASSDLGGGSTAVTGLTLDTGAMSWAAEVTGLTTTYADFLTHVSGLLDEGKTNTAQIAEGLRTVKRSYESADADTRDDFVGLWDAK